LGVFDGSVLNLRVLDFGFLQHLIHGFPLSGPESGHTERNSHAQRRGCRNRSLSSGL
jgi:hypothetical protein